MSQFNALSRTRRLLLALATSGSLLAITAGQMLAGYRGPGN
jgi:hypothetical protein